jgi:hypothetical protein
MAEPYSLKWFLLHAKNEFLRDYFRGRTLLLDVPFAALEEGEADVVFTAVQSLSAEHREECEACFNDIYRMANRSGWDAIIAASRSAQFKQRADEDLAQRLGKMQSNLDRAFWTFLRRPQYWELACLLADADALGTAAWEKHPRVPRVAPRTDSEAVSRFARAVGRYFYTMEGRGERCDIKVCDQGERCYFFCLIEQPSRADPEWKPEGLRRRTYRPAQQLIFVYSQAAGEVDTYLRAKPRAVWDVTALFAQHILGLKKLDPPPKGHGTYRLNGFKRRGTTYFVHPGTGISTVAVRKLRLTPRFGAKRHIIVEANPDGTHEPVYDALENELSNLSLDDFDVTQVELKVVFDRRKVQRKRTISATISAPNRCSLGYDDLDLTVRKMLVASGIELKENPTKGREG